MLDRLRKVFRSQSKNQVDRIVVFSSDHASPKHDFDLPEPRTLDRDQALTFIPFARCINLLTTVAATVISRSVYVVNEVGDVVDDDMTMQTVRLLKETPDGDEASLPFLKDVISDYLIDGNLLVEVERSPAMRPTMLTRLDAENAVAEIADSRRGKASMVYRSVDITTELERVLPKMNVIHSRFHTPAGYQTRRSRRRFFARSNLYYMAKALRLGLEGDSFVQNFFDDGHKSDLVVELPGTMAADAVETWVHYLADHGKSRAPLILPEGATVKQIGSSPSDAKSIEQREYQIQEVSRLYGVPAPLIGLNVTQWGSGIEQLARLMYRFGVKPQLDNILASMSLKMLPRHQRFEVDATEEVMGDTTAISNLVSAMRPSTNTPPVISQKEARHLLGMKGKMNDDWNFQTPSGSEVDRSEDVGDDTPGSRGTGDEE